MTNYIWITTQKEMTHNYPDAPEEVAFLRNEHRHLFKFKVYLEIFGDDRDVEFIIFKRYIDELLFQVDETLGRKSCEMVSNDLYENINKKYPNRKIKIEVSEDGENGVLYEY